MNVRRPTKAMILAAGFGTRMSPLSLQVPKPLMPLWGTPLLIRVMELLHQWGVKDVLINLHHGADAVARCAMRHGPPGLRINFSHEPCILGTGGALRRAAWFFAGDEPVWLVNSDIAADVDPVPLLRAHASGRPLATVWLEPSHGPRTVEMSHGGIRCFRSATPGAPGTFTLCGLHLLSDAVLPYLPDCEACSIVEAYEAAIRRGRRIAGIAVPESFWADVGTPETYLDTHARIRDAYRQKSAGARLYCRTADRTAAKLRREGIVVDGAVAVGDAVDIRPGAKLRDCVVWDRAVLSSRARLDRAVVGEDTRVSGPASGMVLPAAVVGDAALCIALKRLRWPMERTTAIPMSARGSDRDFVRIRCGRRTAVVVRHGLQRPENERYTQNARFLRSIGVRAPRVLVDLPALRLHIVEDLGDVSLLSLAAVASEHRRMQLYEQTLPLVCRLHQRGWKAARARGLELEAPFSRRLYVWEHELFQTHYLQNMLHLSSRRRGTLLAELQSLFPQLQRMPSALVHRDLQSTNVLLVGGEPALIDFQAMRRGPAMYDVASLLCDPYVNLSEKTQFALLHRYAEASGIGKARAEREFRVAAVQRLVQAVGAFARLGSQRATAGFLRHILPGLLMLKRMTADLDNLHALRDFVEEQIQEANHDESSFPS